jgi:predicted phage tail protein
LRVERISGSRSRRAFRVELGAAMIVASTIVPSRKSNLRSTNIASTSQKSLLVREMLI